MWSNLSRFYAHHCTDSSRTWVKIETHNRHPILDLTGELWCVCCEEIGENWPRYNGTGLYVAITFSCEVFKFYAWDPVSGTCLSLGVRVQLHPQELCKQYVLCCFVPIDFTISFRITSLYMATPLLGVKFVCYIALLCFVHYGIQSGAVITPFERT